MLRHLTFTVGPGETLALVGRSGAGKSTALKLIIRLLEPTAGRVLVDGREMFRESLGPDRGMLFPYDPPQPASFWMKNTLIPLDLIFIRADGTVALITANTVPMSLDPIPSLEPVAAVLGYRNTDPRRTSARRTSKILTSRRSARDGTVR